MLLVGNIPNMSQAPKMIVPVDYACIVLWESNGEFIAMLVNESKILFVSGLSCIYNQCSV